MEIFLHFCNLLLRICIFVANKSKPNVTMKRFLLSLVALMGVLVLGGCSAHLYPTFNSNLTKTDVVLTQKNFTVVGQAEGTASTTLILGIGGLSKKALNGNAVAAMYENAKLTGSQTIVNVNVKSSVAGCAPFFVHTTYTATGTIIEFTE